MSKSNDFRGGRKMRKTLLAAAVVIAGTFPVSAKQLLMVEGKIEYCFDVFVSAKNGDGAAILGESSSGALKRFFIIADGTYYDFSISTETEVVNCWVAISWE